jgi:hypothetical protein
MIAIVTPEKIQLSPGAIVHFLGKWKDYQASIEQKFGRINCRQINIYRDRSQNPLREGLTNERNSL